VVLATSEFRHELESDIEPFKGLLLGLFFIAVGASIDFPLIGRELGTVLGLVAGLVLLKAAVLYALGTGARMGRDQRLLFALALAQGGEFCFVLLSFATQNRVLPERVAGLLVATVALSMAMTPLLLVAWERFVATRASSATDAGRPHDDVHGEHAVIIVGFGDFGSTVGRYLNANGVDTTVLDLDSDRVDVLRRLGLRVFYGDASREDLLRSAGADTAKLIILTSGDTEAMRTLAGRIRHAFPHLTILARASGRVGAYELIEAEVPHVVRESLDSALHLGVEALHLLGVRRHEAWRAAQRFRRHDDATLRELAKVFRDRAAHLSLAREAIRDLEQSMRADATGGRAAGRRRLGSRVAAGGVRRAPSVGHGLRARCRAADGHPSVAAACNATRPSGPCASRAITSSPGTATRRYGARSKTGATPRKLNCRIGRGCRCRTSCASSAAVSGPCTTSPG